MFARAVTYSTLSKFCPGTELVPYMLRPWGTGLIGIGAWACSGMFPMPKNHFFSCASIQTMFARAIFSKISYLKRF